MGQSAAAAADLADSRRAAREARKQASRVAAAEAARWALTGRDLHVVVIAYGLSKYSTEAPATFLAALGRQHGWPEKSLDERARMVEDAVRGPDRP